ncbi:MAG TPA: hypothetical protein PLL33_04015, partial [Paracoccus sp. (in: a-proteobacteria)]|nr:hypothetical protein [Paracoccus sp. (in: a-proteobacteria)]
LAITVTRQKMGDHAGPVLITGPDGATAELALEPAGPGHFTGRWQSPGPGLYRLQDGDLARMVAVGPAAPREFERTVADAGALAPLVEVTGGSVHRLSDGIPGLRTVRAGRSATGRGVAGDWIGVTPRGAAAVEGLARRALLPDWLWLLLVGGLALAAWLVEGGRLPQGRETRSD